MIHKIPRFSIDLMENIRYGALKQSDDEVISAQKSSPPMNLSAIYH